MSDGIYHKPGALLRGSNSAAAGASTTMMSGTYAAAPAAPSTMMLAGSYGALGAPPVAPSEYDRVTESMLSDYGVAPPPANNSSNSPLGMSINDRPVHGAYDIVPGTQGPSYNNNQVQQGPSYNQVPQGHYQHPAASMSSQYSLAPAPPMNETTARYATPSAPAATLPTVIAPAKKAAAAAVPCAAPDQLKFAWYHGTIGREQSEQLLANEAPFTFLVRDSNQGPHTFTVSVVKYVGGVAHILAQPVIDNQRIVGYKFGKTDQTVYRSLQHLIEVYSAMTGHLKTLGKALPR